MTHTMLHNKVKVATKILSGLALVAMLITILALPITANADDRPFHHPEVDKTYDVYLDLNRCCAIVDVGMSKATVRWDLLDGLEVIV